MKRRLPFVGITRGVIDGKHIRKMGMAARLFDHLVSRQTDPDGKVNYGKPMTYAQIAEEIPNAPPRTTLRNWLRLLRDGDYVETGIVREGKPARVVGFTVKVLRPKKWSAQLPLFDREGGDSIRNASGYPPLDAGSTPVSPLQAFGKPVEDHVEILRNPVPPLCPKLDRPSVQSWTGKSLVLEEREKETTFRAKPQRAGSAEPRRGDIRLFNLEQKAKRLDREIETLLETTAGAVRGTSEYAVAEGKFLRLSAELRSACQAIENLRSNFSYDERKTGRGYG